MFESLTNIPRDGQLGGVRPTSYSIMFVSADNRTEWSCTT